MEHRIPGRRLVALTMMAMLALTGIAAAEKGGKGKSGDPPGKGASHGKSQGKSSAKPQQGNSAAPRSKGGKKFEDDQRAAIQRYYRDDYSRSGNCPPGLAKKDNGCLPPGQAKRRWNVGAPLPPDVVVMPLPGQLRMTLAAPLPGYDYGYVDGEVILFATSGRIVVDFVAAF